MPPCIFVVYVIRNLVNGKRYVGKTRGRDINAAVKKRWASHLTEAKRERGYLLHRAIRKHGPENFTIGAIGSSETEAGAFLMEKDWIARTSPEYNLTLGGEGASGAKWSDERRARVKDRRLSEGTKEKLRQRMLSRTVAERAKNADAVRRKHIGKVVSQETRIKVSLAKRGKPLKPTASVLARKAARDGGQKHYSGNPCKQGHGTLRYVSTWQCVECHRLWQMNYMPMWRQKQREMHHV